LEPEIMTRFPVVVLGLDAADPVLLEKWLDAGELPNLAAFRNAGTYARLTTFEYCRAEASNTTFLTGCRPDKHGYWSPFQYHPDYRAEQRPYPFDDFKPFYALGPDYRVAVFDMPQTKLSDGVNGVQVLGWGAHSPRCPSHSSPPELYDGIVRKHGTHPTYKKDDVHSMGDHAAMQALKNGLLTGLARRTQICRDLLASERWDLFLTYFSELHSAQHYFWHLSQPDHPLHAAFARPGEDPLLDVFKAVDASIGLILEAAPTDARVLVFSDHGMESNSTDVPSTVLLPELLYRLAFPGRYGLARGRPGTPPPVIRPRPNRSWRSSLYDLKYDRNPVTRWLRRSLPTAWFHYRIEKRLGLDGVPLCPEDCPLGAQPPMWYSPAWPSMRAFALPSFSEGYVRVNVKGREARGIVDPADYERTCGEIEADLRQLVNARTGKPMVKDVVRTRKDPSTARRPGDRPSDADLIVVWSNEPADVVDHPKAGRIGPVPFKRSGSHVHRGFFMAKGPGIKAGARLPEKHALDLAPTIMSLVGAPMPAHFDGQPILSVDSEREVAAAS
jgi:predicted AlkP superfamily phosphohydrolase/phosphomutase